MQKFSGDATPTPRRIDLRAYGAQAQRDTPLPEKNPSYGLAQYRWRCCYRWRSVVILSR